MIVSVIEPSGTSGQEAGTGVGTIEIAAGSTIVAGTFAVHKFAS